MPELLCLSLFSDQKGMLVSMATQTLDSSTTKQVYSSVDGLFSFLVFYFSPFLNIKASIVTKLTAVNLRIKLENNSLKSLIIRDWGRMGWTLTGIPDTPNQLITVTSPLNLQINITEDLFLIFWSETFPQETHKLQDYFLPFMLVKFRSTQKHRVNSSWWAYKSQTQTRQSKQQ